MKKYVINIVQPNSYNAMSKAKDDINHFLNEVGFESINVQKFRNKAEKLVLTPYIIKTKFGQLKKGDVLLLQFPTYLGRRFENRLLVSLRKRGVHLFALIHDLDALRFTEAEMPNRPSLDLDVIDLNQYDVVISSNAVMSNLLKQKGLARPVVDLKIFDYYHDYKHSRLPEHRQSLNFAGNLTKSQFLYDFPDEIQTKLVLFGLYDHSKALPRQSDYRGLFKPEELVGELNQGYGLVWDGKSSMKIKGLIGEYLKYNNPHKASLYLSAGLPVVIWRGAAIAQFIEQNQVGILVDSLADVDRELATITDAQYVDMARSASRLADKLTTGFYIKTAVEQAIALIKSAD
ncbi:MAG: hypothetical protein DUD28_08530 [Lactobacillus sp.]|nr:MAG: hypothetical protein DUD28_08530 [Lactobacillus sp.]